MQKAHTVLQKAFGRYMISGPHRIASPVDQIERYRKKHRRALLSGNRRANRPGSEELAAIRLVLYFHRMTGETARTVSWAHRILSCWEATSFAMCLEREMPARFAPASQES